MDAIEVAFGFGFTVLSLLADNEYWPTLSLTSFIARALYVFLVKYSFFSMGSFNGCIMTTLTLSLWAIWGVILIYWFFLLPPVQWWLGSPAQLVTTAIYGDNSTPINPSQTIFKPEKQALVDVFVVHGLGSNPESTWTHVRNAVKTKWLEEFLPKDEDFKDARIILLNHQTGWAASSSRKRFEQHASSMLEAIEIERRQDPSRPIMFLAHSFGGLLLKKENCTRGIIFLGVPDGGAPAWLVGKAIAQTSYWLSSSTQLLALMSEGSYARKQLLEDFKNNFYQKPPPGYQRPYICEVFEDRPEKLFGVHLGRTVVRKHGTYVLDDELILDTDHRGLNKFGSIGDQNYIKLLQKLKKAYETALVPHVLKPGNKHWLVHRTINSLFTGRTELLRRIQKTLRGEYPFPAGKQKRFVITGLGGQGKSEICLKIADEMREEFWGVFWVDVSKASTAESGFIAIAKILGHSVESVLEALQILATINQSWLLILDNGDDPYFDYNSYFPSGAYGAVLMASRVAECKRYSPDATEVLEGLEDKDAKELLFQAAGFPPESWSSRDSQAEKVVRLLGSHTLALILAGAYIARGHCQLDQYHQVYQRQQKQLLKFQLNQTQSRYSNVYATFEASAELLERSESEAAKDALHLLEILSMVHSGIFPLQAFQEAWNGCRKTLHSDDSETTDIYTMSKSHISQLPSFMTAEGDEWNSYRLIEAQNLLVSLSLVTQHSLNSSTGLSMHNLTHDWVKNRQNEQSVAWIVTGCVLAFCRIDIHLWTDERLLVSHILSYLDITVAKAFLSGSKAIVIPVLLRCGWALNFMRQDSKLSCLLGDIFVELGQSSNKPTKEFLPLYDLQARNLLNLREDKRAVALLEQVVTIRETILVETHPDRLASQHQLASVYHTNGQLKEAVALLEQVVKIRKTTLAETHPNRLASQHELACVYYTDGQVKEAVALLEQVVKIQKTTLAETHPNRIVSEELLAYWSQDVASLLLNPKAQVSESIGELAQRH